VVVGNLEGALVKEEFPDHGRAFRGKAGLLRKLKAKLSLEGGAEPSASQGEIWREVARKLGAMGSPSPSHALHQAYADYAGSLQHFDEKLAAPADCNGAVFVVHGQVAGADLFDKAATLAKLWSKLLRSLALDALEGKTEADRPVTAVAVSEWLRTAALARTQACKSPGLGEEVRLEAPELVGAGLVVDEQPVHVECFRMAQLPVVEQINGRDGRRLRECSRSPHLLQQTSGVLNEGRSGS
jgi:hypothetical protein